MRAGEQVTRRAIRRRFPKNFEYSEKLLAAAHELHGLLCDKDVRPSQNHAKCVVVGLWMKMCKQYRSIIVLCELGLVEDAEVIARCLFESAVQTHFVLKRWPKRCQGWASAPGLPKSIELRADIYLARYALEQQKRLNVWKDSHGCKRVARKITRPIADMVDAAESMIGTAWMSWLRDTKFSAAFRVETMARNVGLHRWYDTVYRPQSAITHSNDALDHLDPGEEPLTIDSQIRADIDRAVEPLHLANALFGKAASTKRFLDK